MIGVLGLELALCIAGSDVAPAARIQDPPSVPPAGESRSALEREVVEPRVLESIERGLVYLERAQIENRDGSFPATGARIPVPVPVAALSALACMSAGNLPDRGPHGASLAKAIDYLLAHAETTALSERYGYISSDGDKLSRMHGHGFATLALSQAYATSPHSPRGERLARALRAAVDLIQRCQTRDGGWYYEPVNLGDHENSVTVCVVQALRGAHSAGILVEPNTIARALEYLKRLQNQDGSFRYKMDVDKNTIALTAAGVSTLNASGRYAGPEVERGIANLWQRLEQRGGADEPAAYAHYERLYVAQALWQYSDGRLFERWADEERRAVLAGQREDGSWSDADFGACYATAMNCLFLALPLNWLPIFQR